MYICLTELSLCDINSFSSLCSKIPFLQARFQKLSCLPQSVGKDPVEHFSLSDLWNFYVERSVYGAAVPMLLNDGDTVVQYYSPSLSAVQIYTCRPLVSVRCFKSLFVLFFCPASILNFSAGHG